MIEINGILYEEIPKPEPRKRVSYAMELLMFSSMFQSPAFSTSNRIERQKVKVSIPEEFALIQQKKSNLSRSEREWVVRQFYKLYKEVKP